MTAWQPSRPEFLAAMREPATWGVDLSGLAPGIDNVHIDVSLSQGFRELATQTLRRLIAEDLAVQVGETPNQVVGAAELDQLRLGYQGLFESLLDAQGPTPTLDRPVLLQLTLLKWLLLATTREQQAVTAEFKRTAQDPEVLGSGRGLELHEQLVAVLRQGSAIERRVRLLLLRQVRRVETGPLAKLRSALFTEAWPFPAAALFNPVLLIPDPERPETLAGDYPIAHLAENGASEWLALANTCLTEGLANYLPVAFRRAPHPKAPSPGATPARERLDQGLLAGFLATELLLSGFMASEEYRSGQVCWLDEPENLRRLLLLPGAAEEASASLLPAPWTRPDWTAFRTELRGLLHRRLEHWGLGERIMLCYWLPTVRNQLGYALPLSLLADYCTGLLPKRRLPQRLAALPGSPDPALAGPVLERTRGALRRFGPAERAPYLNRFLVDFLTLRRDLKLAYKTYEALDGIRLLESDADLRMSRANGTLYEFAARSEAGPTQQRIRAHCVIKADVRGSTRITDELCARGLNPASHFSLNLFAPVNRLLSEFGAEKLFVEGDAVILAIFEYERDGPVSTVARACGLARSILHVVTLRNVLNRKHGLPELELGLGIAFTPREPHFLYDEGRRITISPAINAADRLSACSPRLRDTGLLLARPGQRTLVLRRPPTATEPEELLSYNVNGIRLEQAAFFKLQRELQLRQARLGSAAESDDLYFSGNYLDARGQRQRLAVRCTPVRDLTDGALGERDPQGRHYFEVVADERTGAALRRRMAGERED